MFEKEAEEYAQDMAKYYESAHGSIPSQFEKYLRKAVEFGYNKANEWHYPSKGEYPNNDSDILCQIDFETSEVGYFNEMYNNFYTIDGKELEVIAWKEIVLPKECV